MIIKEEDEVIHTEGLVQDNYISSTYHFYCIGTDHQGILYHTERHIPRNQKCQLPHSYSTERDKGMCEKDD